MAVPACDDAFAGVWEFFLGGEGGTGLDSFSLGAEVSGFALLCVSNIEGSDEWEEKKGGVGFFWNDGHVHTTTSSFYCDSGLK